MSRSPIRVRRTILGRGDQADHGIDTVAACLKIGEDRLHVLLEEQQVGDDHVGAGEGLFRLGKAVRLFVPLGGGEDLHVEAGEVRRETGRGTPRRDRPHGRRA